MGNLLFKVAVYYQIFFNKKILKKITEQTFILGTFNTFE